MSCVVTMVVPIPTATTLRMMLLLLLRCCFLIGFATLVGKEVKSDQLIMDQRVVVVVDYY